MKFPAVHLEPGDSIFQIDEKVEKAFEQAGLSLIAFDGLNAFLDISSSCHFFQVPHEQEPGVIVVLSEPWEERTLIQVLNVLLEMRMDPDPPGSRLSFNFYCPYEVPAVLLSTFGSSPCCFFECRALLVARFGHELGPWHGQQLGALAVFLVRDCFQQKTDFFDPGGDVALENLLLEEFLKDKECLEPINSLMAIGCLYGEILRTKLPYRARWAEVEECNPWPGLVFDRGGVDEGAHDAPGQGAIGKGDIGKGDIGKADLGKGDLDGRDPASDEASDPASDTDAAKPAREVVFNPIAHVVQFFKSPTGGAFARAREELERRCRDTLGEPADSPPDPDDSADP